VITRDGKVAGVVGFDLSAAEGGDIYTRSGHPLVFQTALFREYIENPPSSEATETGGEDAWLGVFTQPLTDDLAAYWDLPPDGGIIVSTVIPGSPADKSGLRMGDVIVSFNGRPIHAKEDPDVVTFTKVVRESPLGEPLPLQLYRDGEPMEMRLTLLPRPKSGRDANELEDTTFGLTVRELTTDVRIALNLSDEIDGVIVRRVTSGSPAALAGLRPGFVIMTIGGRPVGSLTEYAEAVAAEEEAGNPEVTLFCRVGANTAFFRLQPRWEN
jgi:serine protease Do